MFPSKWRIAFTKHGVPSASSALATGATLQRGGKLGKIWIEKSHAHYAIMRMDGLMAPCVGGYECSQKLPLYQRAVACTSGLGMNLSMPDAGAVCQLAKSLCSGLFTVLEMPGAKF